MSRKTLIFSIALVVLAAIPTVAGEIVYFNDGTTMTIQSHISREGIVRVNLGGQSFMAFPMERIERIVTTDGRVLLDENTVSANQMTARPRSTTSTITGRESARQRRGSWAGSLTDTATDNSQSVDKNGLAVFLPYGANAAANKRGVGVVGRRELLNSATSKSKRQGIIGTSKRGSRYVLPTGKTNASRPKPVGISLRGEPTVQQDKK